jgi:APA family basic amino acid/polyamine antiporter
MVAAFFSMGGWWDVSKIGGEIRDPSRTLPRALLLGGGVVTVVYMLMTLVFLYLVPLERIDSREAFAALAGEALFGRAGGVVLTWVVLVAITGSLAALLLAMPRVYFAMARDGLFFVSVAALHPRFQTPARAIAIQAFLASLLAVLGTFDEILAYFVVPTVVFVALTVGSVFVVGRRRGAGMALPPLRVPWHPLPPLLFLVHAAALLALLIADRPGHAAIGLAIVLLGLPVYALAFRPLRPAATGTS